MSLLFQLDHGQIDRSFATFARQAGFTEMWFGQLNERIGLFSTVEDQCTALGVTVHVSK